MRRPKRHYDFSLISDNSPAISHVTDFRIIPSVEQLRQREAMRALETRYGRTALLIDALRAETGELRERLAAGRIAAITLDEAVDAIERGTEARLRAAMRPSLVRAINATGVIVHTNLGRAPLSEAALERVREIAGGYTNLEYDLATGARGKRDVHAEKLIARLTGAEAAVVVNNNAAATMLILAALATGREVIISRGELVEIGGGFRVPDVMAQSGAVLREVGTTNRTRVADYAAAINDRTALILRVHPSNFTSRRLHGASCARRPDRARTALQDPGRRGYRQRLARRGPDDAATRDRCRRRCATSRSCRRASAPAWTSSASAATSCSAARRRALSPAGARASTRSVVTR